MPKFNIHVSQTIIESKTFEIHADNQEDAEAIAMERAEDEIGVDDFDECTERQVEWCTREGET